MWHLPPFATVTHRTLALALLVASMTAPRAAAGAAWLAEGLAIAPSDSVQSDAVLATDGAGGAFVAWQDYRAGGISIFAQHLRADGTVAPGWPAGGRALSTGAASDPVILADGQGGALVAAPDGYDVHLWHLSGDGSLDALTVGEPAAAGRAHRTGPLDAAKYTPTVLPVLCPDGGGGAFLAWEQGGFLRTAVLVQHLLPGGSPDPTWPANGALAEPTG